MVFLLLPLCPLLKIRGIFCCFMPLPLSLFLKISGSGRVFIIVSHQCAIFYAFLSVEFNAAQKRFLSCLENQKICNINSINFQKWNFNMIWFCLNKEIRLLKYLRVPFYGNEFIKKRVVFELLGFNKRNNWPLEIKNLKKLSNLTLLDKNATFLSGYSPTCILKMMKITFIM